MHQQSFACSIVLSEVFVGKAKESLNLVDAEQSIFSEVVSVFGPFVKVHYQEKKMSHRRR